MFNGCFFKNFILLIDIWIWYLYTTTQYFFLLYDVIIYGIIGVYTCFWRIALYFIMLRFSHSVSGRYVIWRCESVPRKRKKNLYILYIIVICDNKNSEHVRSTIQRMGTSSNSTLRWLAIPNNFLLLLFSTARIPEWFYLY